MEIIYVQVEIKWRMIWKYLNMFKRQRDSHRTHHFLWQRPLTTRPPECINHDMITIIFFTICRMWVVILRLFCAQVMRLSCWCSLDQFLSNKTKLISTKNWVIFKRMPEWSFFMILTRPKTTSWTKQTNIFQDHYRGFFKFHKLTRWSHKKMYYKWKQQWQQCNFIQYGFTFINIFLLHVTFNNWCNDEAYASWHTDLI